ncbi:LytR/AlgR family response regulator transcription factor [Thermosediminibacter litoriperuensis]|uniref:Stage 0 sporulation protein A homolog n=1 Tax=Thermosediminibacter litoriperuensis TaxID=291989 RepID=A0A5S5AH18_9FIRM|nr:LytTR family DNA-binding domain-containing protein [Thermosediminibacter litoriperuensis]TYP49764.1 LytTR family two component transcriptional regulator [Thermosediminibacter litoriperuensis]
MELTVLLVDDESPARDELRYLLEAYPEINVVGEASSGQEAIDKVIEFNPDVVFLDIKLWDMDGFEVARRIFEKGRTPFIIFATAYDEYAVKAFEINAVDYILKPFSAGRLEKTVQKIIDIFKNQRKREGVLRISEYLGIREKPSCNKLSFWKNERIYLVCPEDICYCVAVEKGSIVKARQGEFNTTSTLSELEEKINSPSFFRTHKSYLVNLDRVKEIIPWFNGTFILSIQGYEKDEVPVSRRQAKVLRRLFDI